MNCESPEIEITSEMIEAGAAELVFDSRLIRYDVAYDIICAALEAGGYKPVESALKALREDGAK